MTIFYSDVEALSKYSPVTPLSCYWNFNENPVPCVELLQASWMCHFITNVSTQLTRGVGRILPTPLVFISGYANTVNVFYCLNER